MAWNIEGTREFEAWFGSLDRVEQDAVICSVDLLKEKGPTLARPHADTVRGSRFPNMRELRSQARGKPLRTFYAFDPRRTAILLIGGKKTEGGRFYQAMIPMADQLYATYLEELKLEGLI